jgi:CheY-like chemotaxis protein
VIVLVDDNEDDQNLTVKALARAGLTNEVVVLDDGLDALQYFEAAALTDSDAQRTHLVLLDLNMPGLGGIEVLRRLRSAPSTHNLVVVVLTSSDEERDMLESYNVGANSYVRKPVDFATFTAVIQELSSYWLSLNRPPPGGLVPRGKKTERVN